MSDERFAALSNCWIARREVGQSSGRVRKDPAGKRMLVAVLSKILRRGSRPPLHPEAERLLLESEGFASRLTEAPLIGDIGPRLDPPNDLLAKDFEIPWDGDPPEFDGGLTDPNSPPEARFIEWAARASAESVRWLIPQVTLDPLIRAGTHRSPPSEVGGRCYDFLYCAPNSNPVAIEIDGPQHLDALEADEASDRALRGVGIRTIRVATSEFAEESGEGLRELLYEFERHERSAPIVPSALVWASIQTHRLIAAICEALDSGWLTGSSWYIELLDPTGYAASLTGPYLELIDALDCLWGDRTSAPQDVTISAGDKWYRFERSSPCRYHGGPVAPPAEWSPQVRLLLECHRTPSETLPHEVGTPTVVVRSTSLPVHPQDSVPLAEDRTSFAACPNEGEQRFALETILQAVFAKGSLREGQFEALRETLAGRDCMVLLPTGAGKSMIYQLAGLCLPGATIVVDPLISLMDDQIHSLQSQGIDRAEQINSATRDFRLSPGEAHFTLITPEQLQRKSFRNELAERAFRAPVSLVVIDEAHCVSEWGHDFRTAYLNIGPTLRKRCAGDLGTPALLALTGTASRAVLKDALYQLGIVELSPHTIVRPGSFDREEITFLPVVRASPDDRVGKLRQSLGRIASAFRENESIFFSPRANRTQAGIIFSRTATGPHGVVSTADAVRDLIPSVEVYSGRDPYRRRGGTRSSHDTKGSWQFVKAENARRFKENEAASIVATNAFGMGIDKPNVRWIVHFGLPSSIEAFYQEVGRAGRDGRQAVAVLILTDHDRVTNERILRSGQIKDSGKFDDISTAAYFHRKTFPAIEAEVETLVELYHELADGSHLVRLGSSEERRTQRKRALHRLALLGIVQDYTLEDAFQSEKANVSVRHVTINDVVEGLLGFLRNNQPAKLDRAERVLLQVRQHWATVGVAVEYCGKRLIESLYSTVEAARQRSLLELWVAAGAASTDGDVLKRRVLEVLTEGDISRYMEKLHDAQGFSYSTWLEAWESLGDGGLADGMDEPGDEVSRISGMFVSENDTREWRSGAARLLTSFPEHPGLLASRGIAEVLLADGDLREFENDLMLSLEVVGRDFRSEGVDSERFVGWLLGLFGGSDGSAVTRRALESAAAPAIELVAATVCAARRAHVAEAAVDSWMDENWHRGRQLGMLRLAEGLEFARDLAGDTQSRFEEKNNE